jgi:hypothetical protein
LDSRILAGKFRRVTGGEAVPFQHMRNLVVVGCLDELVLQHIAGGRLLAGQKRVGQNPMSQLRYDAVGLSVGGRSDGECSLGEAKDWKLVKQEFLLKLDYRGRKNGG